MRCHCICSWVDNETASRTMKKTIKCQHCEEEVDVQALGDCWVCPKCKSYIFSVSQVLKEQIFGKEQGG